MKSQITETVSFWQRELPFTLSLRARAHGEGIAFTRRLLWLGGGQKFQKSLKKSLLRMARRDQRRANRRLISVGDVVLLASGKKAVVRALSIEGAYVDCGLQAGWESLSNLKKD